MKTLIEAIVGFVVVVIVAGGVILATMSAMVETTAGALALAFATIMVLGLFGTLAVVVGIWLWDWTKRSTTEHAQAAEFIRPDEHGRLPISIAALRNPEVTLQVLDTYRSSYMQNVTTYHNKPTSTITGADAPTLQIAAAAPMSFAELYQRGQLPEHGFLMGYAVGTNEPVVADWRKLYSALIGGQSGSGKSTLIRSILAQAALQGGKFVVCDPHFGAGDESLGASLQPLRSRMMCKVASDDKTMTDALKVIQRIGQRRIAGTDQSHDPIILIVDETTALLQRSSVADLLADVLGQISQETRKVGLYALCIGQNFSGEVMPTVVRNSFVSFIATRSRRDVARTMTANADFAKVAADLSIGQAVWMTPAGDVHTLQVPNCTSRDLDLVAGSGFRVVDEKPASHTGNAPFPTHSRRIPEAIGSALFDDSGNADGMLAECPGNALGMSTGGTDPRAERVRQMIKDRRTHVEIIKEIWGETQGRAYQRAQSELAEIIAGLM